MLILGQVIVDVSNPGDPANIKLRLGGVVHAARMAWAADLRFSVGYIAPDYLIDQAEEFLAALGASSIFRIGSVRASPNVMLIPHPSEAGPQGYEWVLGDDREVSIEAETLSAALHSEKQQVLVFPDRTDVAEYSRAWPSDVGAVVAVDSGLTPEELEFFGIGCFITSTSGEAVLATSPMSVAERAIAAGASMVVVKENRGGTRAWGDDGVHAVGAVLGPAQHSVGVGDAYDVVLLESLRDRGVLGSMQRASLLAANYAATTNPDVLRELAAASMALPPGELEHLPGPHLGWEDRSDRHIYIAAPDFDWVDTDLLDQLESALRYHNFTPRRPVREFGQADVTDRQLCEKVFTRDRDAIDGAAMVVAVLLFNDPGTLLEAGYAAGRGTPVILWDPLRRFDNVWLWGLPTFRAESLEDVIRHVFVTASRERR